MYPVSQHSDGILLCRLLLKYSINQYTVQSTQYTVDSKQYTSHSTQHTVHSTHYTLHNTLHTSTIVSSTQ